MSRSTLLFPFCLLNMFTQLKPHGTQFAHLKCPIQVSFVWDIIALSFELMLNGLHQMEQQLKFQRKQQPFETDFCTNDTLCIYLSCLIVLILDMCVNVSATLLDFIKLCAAAAMAFARFNKAFPEKLF